MPSTHEGSLKSSTENKDFSSKEETNFSLGAASATEQLLPTGYVTCRHKLSMKNLNH